MDLVLKPNLSFHYLKGQEPGKEIWFYIVQLNQRQPDKQTKELPIQQLRSNDVP